MNQLIFTYESGDQEEATRRQAMRAMLENLERMLGSAVVVEDALLVRLDGSVGPAVEELIEKAGLTFIRMPGEKAAARKNGRVHPVSAPAATEPPAALPVCPNCGKAFERRRKDQKYCLAEACQAVKRREYQKAWWRANRKGTAASPAEQVTIFPEVNEAEPAEPAEADPLADDQVYELEPEEEAEVQAYPWMIEDGPHAGTRMTVAHLKKALINGNMRNGQHLRHVENGQHRVVKGHYPSQKLERVFGDGAPFYLLPGEL